jgi:hypothetical protein
VSSECEGIINRRSVVSQGVPIAHCNRGQQSQLWSAESIIGRQKVVVCHAQAVNARERCVYSSRSTWEGRTGEKVRGQTPLVNRPAPELQGVQLLEL